MPIGATASPPQTLPDLSSIRARKGITLHQIATTTKISTYYLEAIERSEFGRLPGGVFSTSYIRQYARAIDYDEWDLLAYYDAVTSPREDAQENPQPRRLMGMVEPIMRLFAATKRA